MLLFSLFVFGMPAQAVDTSGCSPSPEAVQSQELPSGATLKIVQTRAPRRDCWNADSSSYSFSYRFTTTGPIPNVSFWTSVNGKAGTLVQARVSCTGSFSYEADTSKNPVRQCAAETSLTAAYADVDLEIAPFVNGKADTKGYGQNTRFRF